MTPSVGRNQSKPTTFNLKVDDKDIERPDEVTQYFNNYFSGVGSKIADSVGEGSFKYDEYMTKTTGTFHFQIIDSCTVFHMLLSISASKATGLDKIPAKILKIAAPVFANFIIIALFQCCYQLVKSLKKSYIGNYLLI